MFSETWNDLTGLIARVESGVASYQEYQDQLRVFESNLLETDQQVVAAPALMVLSVARYSAYQIRESPRVPQRAKVKWWNVLKQDLLGAVAGSGFGPWGSVGGGVIFSAAEIEDQRSEEQDDPT